jgi:uncharacterized membrane protein YphA (DoxX/SURF4 family)
MGLSLRDLPGRITTGVFIAHAGWDKWKADEQHAAAVHGMAAGAYPVLNEVPAPAFVKALAGGELALGTALVLPFVPNRLAGAGLTAFAAGLLGMYLRTPALHKPGSIWPTQAGTGISKDIWMLGIGLGLLAGGASRD